MENKNTSVGKKVSTAFTVKVASTLEEREAVFRLAYQIYLEKKYIKGNTQRWFVRNYDIFNQTTILIVQDKDKNLVGSVTLVFGSDGELPIENIYSDELRSLKKQGHQVVEISRLIIAKKHRHNCKVLLQLMNYLMIYTCCVKKQTSLVVQVNPIHKSYYKSLLGFEEVGRERKCPSMQNAPAVLLSISLSPDLPEALQLFKKKQREKSRSLYRHFLKPDQEILVAEHLKKQFKPMSIEEQYYFGLSASGMNQAVCT